jgi:2-octaprenyl-6-methoxyphenol hydroxylase
MLIQNTKEKYDLVVIGAGMVGASFALALGRALRREASILIVEAAHVDPDQADSPSFDDRSTALSFGSSLILQNVGLWESIADSLTPIDKIHVSDRGHFGSALLDADSEGVAALGYVVENRRFGQSLNRALHDSENISLLAPAKVESIKPIAAGMQLQLLGDGDKSFQLESSVVVLADGGRSPICNQLGIVTDREQYDQQAMIANIAFEKSHDNIAFERFTDSGPLAILPLKPLDGQNRGALVWTLPDSSVADYMALDDSQLLDSLQQRFGYRLGTITRIGQRFCYPLSLQVAREQIRPGLVLLGNVAHTLHPVAGQGFNLALRDAEVLAEVFAEALNAGIVPGDMQVLQKFVRRQAGDQSRTIGFSHYLTRLFSSNRSSLVWARKFGLASIDILPLVKHEFAHGAMGMADR